MNSLMDTRLFEAVDKSFEITPLLRTVPNWIDKYIVDRDKYDYLIQIAKTFKFPLMKNVVAELEKGLIKPVIFEDPKNYDDKRISFPTSISGILTKEKGSGKIVTYVDTGKMAEYVRIATTKEVEAYSIGERQFYALMQRGYVARYLQMNGMSLNTTPKFVKTVASAYARMVTKPISAVYSTGAKEEWIQKLRYITIVFCLQNFFDYDQEKARGFAFSFPEINREYIIANSKYYNCKQYDVIDMRYDVIKKIHANDKGIKYPIDVYIQILKSEFEEMKNGNIEFRTILDRFTSMYGNNGMLALEHCETFVNMILTADLKINYYNDLGIVNLTKNEVDIISTIINR